MVFIQMTGLVYAVRTVTTLRAACHKGFVNRFPARADPPRLWGPLSRIVNVRRLGAYGSALTIIERRKNARNLTYNPLIHSHGVQMDNFTKSHTVHSLGYISQANVLFRYYWQQWNLNSDLTNTRLV
jgi:hypothetical protein